MSDTLNSLLKSFEHSIGSIAREILKNDIEYFTSKVQEFSRFIQDQELARARIRADISDLQVKLEEFRPHSVTVSVPNFSAKIKELETKVEDLGTRCAQLTTLLGRILDTDDLDAALDNDGFVPSQRFIDYVDTMIEQQVDTRLDAHTELYYHHDDYHGMWAHLKPFVRDLIKRNEFEDEDQELEHIWGLIENRVTDEIDDRMKGIDSETLSGAIHDFFRRAKFDLSPC